VAPGKSPPPGPGEAVEAPWAPEAGSAASWVPAAGSAGARGLSPVRAGGCLVAPRSGVTIAFL